jgi:hypothetical protein
LVRDLLTDVGHLHGRFVADPTVVDALRTTLLDMASRASPLEPSEGNVLRERVCAVVDEMKAAGQPPERIVVAIKRIGQEAGLGGFDDRLAQRLIRWCLERYYGPAASE